jgi:peptidoglycan/xylan/chitin deacetylase (PgdA/CDA1 family)
MFSRYRLPAAVRRLLPEALCTLPGAPPAVALTFDDGPDPAFTPRVLEALKRAQTPATFFVVGRQVEQTPGLVREIARQGHVLGVHGYDHRSLLWRSGPDILRELERAARAVERAGGRWPRLFRPPYGRIRPGALKALARAGWRTVLWDVVPYDFSAGSARLITQRAVEHARAGSIIVLHDGGGDRTRTVTALPEIIARLGKRFTFVTLE